jgi:hypothetical protein
VGSEDEAINSGKDNIVEIGDQDLFSKQDDGSWSQATGIAFRVEGESFDRMRVTTSTTEKSPNYPGVYAHEFGHTLGVTHAGFNLFAAGGGARGTRGLRMTPNDFPLLFPQKGSWSNVHGSANGVTYSGPYIPGSAVRRSTRPTLEIRRAHSVQSDLSNS